MFQKLDSAKLSQLGKFQDQHYRELVDGFKMEISSDDGLEGTGRTDEEQIMEEQQI